MNNNSVLSPEEVNRQIWLCASFHLPLSLEYASDRGFYDWGQLSEWMVELLRKRYKAFEMSSACTDMFANFPGGNPVRIRYNMFWETIDLVGALITNGLMSTNSGLSLDHEIWLCPGGAVLLVGRLTFDGTCQYLTVKALDQVVQSIYCDFAKVFLVVVEALMPFCREIVASGLMSSRKAQMQIVDFVMRPRPGLGDEMEGQCPFFEYQGVLADLLEDVYYLDFLPEMGDETLNIGYFSSEICCALGRREEYGTVFIAAFVAFREMLWMHESLAAFTDRMQTGLCDLRRTPSGDVASIRLVRLACMRFIDESRPMRIRLTREFMECIERCWNEFRMHDVVQQIRDQLSTLVETGEWFESIRNEIRNFRIAAVGVVFTALSFLSVAIAFVDLVYPTPRDYGRIVYALSGGAIGALLAVVLLVSPASLWLRVLRHSMPGRQKRHLRMKRRRFVKR